MLTGDSPDLEADRVCEQLLGLPIWARDLAIEQIGRDDPAFVPRIKARLMALRKEAKIEPK